MAAAIFNAGTVKLLKNTLRFKDGTDFTSVNLVSTTNTKTLTNKTLTNPLITAGGTIDLTAAGSLGIATNAGANNITLGGATSTVVVAGNLQVDGTTTSVNSDVLDVEDANITVNKNGNQAAADSADAGLTVEMSDATDAIIHYDSTVASKWKVGLVGSSKEIVDVDSTQELYSKTFQNPVINVLDSDFTIANAGDDSKLVQFDLSGIATSTTRTFTLPNVSDTIAVLGLAQTFSDKTLDNSNIVTLQDNNFTLQDNADNTKQLQHQLSSITTSTTRTITWQDKDYSPIGVEDIYNMAADDGTFTAVANTTYVVDTSSSSATVTLPAAATSRFVRLKDNGNANTNNIVVNTPGAETVDGAASDTIDSDFGSVAYVSNGTNWFKL